jgi:hypothetical protein
VKEDFAMFWPLVVIAMALVVGLFVWLDISESRRARVAKLLSCPVTGRGVEVVFRADYLDPHHYQGVAACSAFRPGEPVSCSMACLQLTKQQIDFSVAA